MCALACLAGLMLAAVASAMSVTTIGDSGGGCTLRDAIEAVSANNGAGICGPLGSGTTIIELPAGHYTLAAGELLIGSSANLSIVGSDPSDPTATTIDAGAASRVLEVKSGAHATLAALEVTGGQTASGANHTGGEQGGGFGENGGGILNHGTLTLEHVAVIGNGTGHGGRGGDGEESAGITRNPGGGGGGGNGGGIYNDLGATLTVKASMVSGNLTGDGGNGGNGADGEDGIGHFPNGADGGNAGSSGSGGGIFNAGTATIATSTISGNFTGRGGIGGDGGNGVGETLEPSQPGGIGGDGGLGGTGALRFSSESDNATYAAFGGGGGIDNEGSLEMSASTINGNGTGAGGNGGGAGIGGTKAFGGNKDGGHGGEAGSGGLGGGLLTHGSFARLTNVTIANNQTGDGGIGGNGAQSESLGGGNGGFGGYGGGIWAPGTNTAIDTLLTDVTVFGNHLGASGPGGSDTHHNGVDGGRGMGAGLATGPAFGASGGGVTITDSIFDANGIPASGDANCLERVAGDIHDGGHDISFPDNSCPGTKADPLLGALANNGGPTLTLLPASGSSAIGIVPLGSCSVSVDQRGFSRPGPGKSACDAGAVEAGGASGGGAPPSSTSLSSSANPATVGAQVTFTATVSPTPGLGGFVGFTQDGQSLPGCSGVAVSGGKASCTTTYAVAGSHEVKAKFSGNSEFEPSVTPPLTQVVQAATSGGSGGGETPGGGGSGGGNPSGGGNSGGGAPGAGQASVGGTKVKGLTATVPLTCAGATGFTCVLKTLLSATEVPGGHPRLNARPKSRSHKKLTVGSANVTIPAGATKDVPITLNAVGRSLLAKAHDLKVTLTVSESELGHLTPLFTRTLTFKAPKK